MLKRIRELDLDAIVGEVRRATDVARGRACHPLIQEELDQCPRLGQRLASLRDHLGIAAMKRVAAPEDLQIGQPLVEAFVRTHHHPAAPGRFADFELPGKRAAGPRLSELAKAHPRLRWDAAIVRSLLFEAVQENGEHTLDDASPPWRMYWGPSSAAAHALMVLLTYEAFGSLEAPRERIDREALRAHDEWIRRKRQGAGRLLVADAAAPGGGLQASALSGACLARVNLRGAVLQYADLTGATLRECNMDRARIHSARFEDAEITDCTFEGAAGEIAKLDRARVAGARFDHARLRVSQWSGAKVERSSFAHADLSNACLDGAVFVECDFRGANLGAASENPAYSMRGAKFASCDLREADFTRANLDGATFERCTFAGARGEPKSAANVTVVGADVGGVDELLARLEESLSVEAVVAHAGPLVAARDPSDPTRLAVFLVDGPARLLTRLPASAALEHLPKGATYGKSGVVWSWDADAFTIWDWERVALQARGDSIEWPGGPIDRALVTRVGSFVNPTRLGNRGVKLVMPSLEYGRLVVVQDNDFAADGNPSYTRADARRDGEWALHAGRDLAAWLGVPHDDEL